jgi:hypothetical protein
MTITALMAELQVAEDRNKKARDAAKGGDHHGRRPRP